MDMHGWDACIETIWNPETQLPCDEFQQGVTKDFDTLVFSPTTGTSEEIFQRRGC